MHFDGDPFSAKKKTKKEQISHFYGSFSNDIMAVKELRRALPRPDTETLGRVGQHVHTIRLDYSRSQPDIRIWSEGK